MLRVTPSGSRKGFLICYVHHNSLVKYTGQANPVSWYWHSPDSGPHQDVVLVCWRRQDVTEVSFNPDPKLISHRFDRLTALRFSKGRNLP